MQQADFQELLLSGQTICILNISLLKSRLPIPQFYGPYCTYFLIFAVQKQWFLV